MEWKWFEIYLSSANSGWTAEAPIAYKKMPTRWIAIHSSQLRIEWKCNRMRACAHAARHHEHYEKKCRKKERKSLNISLCELLCIFHRTNTVNKRKRAGNIVQTYQGEVKRKWKLMKWIGLRSYGFLKFHSWSPTTKLIGILVKCVNRANAKYHWHIVHCSMSNIKMHMIWAHKGTSKHERIWTARDNEWIYNTTNRLRA